jgi:hypothetical protein
LKPWHFCLRLTSMNKPADVGAAFLNARALAAKRCHHQKPIPFDYQICIAALSNRRGDLSFPAETSR